MKEYALFTKQNGDAELFCGGQYMRGASGLGLASNVAGLWSALDDAGERLVEIRETGMNELTGEQTFVVKTLPKGVKRTPTLEEAVSASDCQDSGGMDWGV